MEKKICTKCKSEKDLSNFGTRTRKNSKGIINREILPSCKICVRLKREQYFKDNPEYQKNYSNKNRKRNNEQRRIFYSKNKELFKKRYEKFINNNPDYNKKQYQKHSEKINKRLREEYKKNPERFLGYNKKWKKNNPEKSKEIDRTYRKDNVKKIKEYRESKKTKERRNYLRNKRKKTDPVYKLTNNMRTRINAILKGKNYTKKSRTHEILGCSFQELKIYIESKFEPWMNWDNHGKYNGQLNYGWDLDHIIPLSIAKNEGELLRLNHYTNFQPLCSYTNRYIKKDNIID